MRKLATLALAVLMVVSLLAVSAAAESYIPNEHCSTKFEVKKANPANVVKDGKIGAGEYVEVEVDKDDLSRNFIDSAVYEDSETMAESIKYYFSWDETHGLNFAVVFDAGNGFHTSFDQPTPNEEGKLMDDFCYNLGLNFSSGRADGMPYFYYSIGKKIQDGSYLNGHWNQLGADPSYSPVGGKDFEVSYNGTVCTFEWSIPLSVLNVSATAGSTVELNIAACAGNFDYDSTKWPTPGDARGTWGVSLGEFGFMCTAGKENQPAKATLSNEMIPGGGDNTTVAPTPGPDTSEATTPAPTQPVTTRIETSIVTETVPVTDTNGEIVTDTNGNQVTEVVSEVVSNVVTDAPAAPTSPITGDPAVIAAVVAAISACGVVVAKKRK